MKHKITIVFLFIYSLMFSQKEHPKEHAKLRMNLNVGMNMSKFVDGYSWKHGKRLAVGTSFFFDLTSRLSLRASLDYSPKSSIGINTNTKIICQYVDFSVSPSIKISNDLNLHFGVSYSQIINSYFSEINGSTIDGYSKTKIPNYDSEINGLMGLELRLQNNVYLFSNFTIPGNRSHTRNIQLGLRITLNQRIKKDVNYRKIRIENSHQQIKELKSAVLLVRLKTNENSIQALQDKGQIETAERLRVSQAIENKKIIQAFKEQFHFCEVKFFFSNHSNQVRQKQYEQIFLNDSLEVDPSITMDKAAQFYIAEFGYIEQVYKGDSSSTPNVVPSHIRFFSLRMMDENFVQLEKPFPYYVRTISKTMKARPEQILLSTPILLASLSWSYEEAVSKMNRKLEKFLAKTDELN
jgi:hypothetical protein